MHLWMGLLHNRCYDDINGTLDTSSDRNCGYRSCPEGYHCAPLAENPNYGVTNFDNFGYAVLSLFQVVTLEGWSDIMYKIMDADGWWASIIFMVIVMIGAQVRA